MHRYHPFMSLPNDARQQLQHPAGKADVRNFCALYPTEVHYIVNVLPRELRMLVGRTLSLL